MADYPQPSALQEQLEWLTFINSLFSQMEEKRREHERLQQDGNDKE